MRVRRKPESFVGVREVVVSRATLDVSRGEIWDPRVEVDQRSQVRPAVIGSRVRNLRLQQPCGRAMA